MATRTSRKQMKRVSASIPRIPIPPTVLKHARGFWDCTCAFDVDETLLAFTALVEVFVKDRLQSSGQSLSENLRDCATYYFHRDPHTGLSKEEIGNWIREIASLTRGGFGDLQFLPGAIESINALRQGGIRPMILTNVPGALDISNGDGQRFLWGAAQEARLHQLKSSGIIEHDNDVIFCEAHSKPSWMLDYSYHIPVLVDDRPSTLVSAHTDHGLIAVGIRSEHTRYNHQTLNHQEGHVDDYGVVWFSSVAAAVPSILEVYRTLAEQGLLRATDQGRYS